MSENDNAQKILSLLADVLEERKQADPASSYVAGLFAGGEDEILKKVGEEAVETILAAKSGDKSHLTHEVADLWFHSLVLLAQQNIHPSAILEELQRRFGTSGIEEKRSRKSS